MLRNTDNTKSFSAHGTLDAARVRRRCESITAIEPLAQREAERSRLSFPHPPWLYRLTMRNVRL
jgi:hypothetical protein